MVKMKRITTIAFQEDGAWFYLKPMSSNRAALFGTARALKSVLPGKLFLVDLEVPVCFASTHICRRVDFPNGDEAYYYTLDWHLPPTSSSSPRQCSQEQAIRLLCCEEVI